MFTALLQGVELMTDRTDIATTPSSAVPRFFRMLSGCFLELDIAPLLKKSWTSLAEQSHIPSTTISSLRILRADRSAVMLLAKGNAKRMHASVGALLTRTSVGRFGAAMLDALATGTDQPCEIVARILDGSEVRAVCGIFGSTLNPDTKLISIGLLLRERDSQAGPPCEAEIHYRDLLHSMPIGLLRIDSRRLFKSFTALRRKGIVQLSPYLDAHPEFITWSIKSIRIEDANLRAVELFGASDKAQLRGTLDSVWCNSAVAWRDLLTALYDRAADSEWEVSMQCADGRMIDALYMVRWTSSAHDPATGVIGIVDLSACARTKRNLHQLRTELDRTWHLSVLAKLTADIAHEINQPLTAIVVNSGVALRRLQSENACSQLVSELCTSISTEAVRAANVVRRMRGCVATPISDSSQMVDVVEAIKETIALLQFELEHIQAVSRIEVENGMPEVRLERTRLQQVIVCLVTNSIQAMADNIGRTPTITIRAFMATHARLCVQVDDSGPGIPAEHMPHLFTMFYTTKRDSIGVGLSVSQSIVESYGGSISASNLEPPMGARFEFFLPIADVAFA